MTALADIQNRYGDLSGEALLKPMIRDVFPGRIALVSSFGAESAVLLHMVAQVDPETPVIFLNTGKLFEETLQYQKDVTARLGLKDVRVIEPDARDLELYDPAGDRWREEPDSCCQIRKVEPLERALRGFSAWINGRKRFQGGERDAIGTLEHADWRIKVNPLATWSPEEVHDYFENHALPAHPLRAKGYGSIGCLPCTAPAGTGEASRDGRWLGSEKNECGIHWTANGKPIRVPVQAPAR